MLTESGRESFTDKKFDTDVADQKFINKLFLRLSAKGKTFRQVNFRYSIFDNCYLRACKFDSCDFTGCKFVGSNLYGSSFEGCTFDYAIFERTIIEDRILQVGCPGPENLKLRFARTLRTNFQQLGDAAAANMAIKIELEATREHYFKGWRSPESYYRKKYKGRDRLKMFLRWIEFRALDLLWGNGESALKLIRFATILVVLLAFYDVFTNKDPDRVSHYIEALVRAPQTIFGVGETSHIPPVLLTTLTIARLVLVAFFISIIVKRFNRR